MVTDFRKPSAFSWIKWAVLSLFLIMLLFIVGYCCRYYLLYIYPQFDRVEKLLENADFEHKTLPAQVSAMLEISLGCSPSSLAHNSTQACEDIKSWQVTCLIVHRQQERHLQFQLRQGLIDSLVIDRLSGHDKNVLLSNLSVLGYDNDGQPIRGLNQLAKDYYDKPLSQLNLDEVATVIHNAYGKAYSLFEGVCITHRLMLCQCIPTDIANPL